MYFGWSDNELGASPFQYFCICTEIGYLQWIFIFYPDVRENQVKKNPPFCLLYPELFGGKRISNFSQVTTINKKDEVKKMKYKLNECKDFLLFFVW